MSHAWVLHKAQSKQQSAVSTYSNSNKALTHKQIIASIVEKSFRLFFLGVFFIKSILSQDCRAAIINAPTTHTPIHDPCMYNNSGSFLLSLYSLSLFLGVVLSLALAWYFFSFLFKDMIKGFRVLFFWCVWSSSDCYGTVTVRIRQQRMVRTVTFFVGTQPLSRSGWLCFCFALQYNRVEWEWWPTQQCLISTDQRRGEGSG